jgi:pseudo-response regulator 1
MLNYDFDLVASEPSDANTNSTTLFSDDTDDRSKRNTIPETEMSVQQEQVVSVKKKLFFFLVQVKKKYLNNAIIESNMFVLINLKID